MNYRHAYHAGNFADVTKHALLVALIRALQRKEGGIAVLDTHAGCGVYALDAPEPSRTQEWRGGIGRLLDSDDAALADYLTLMRRLGAPGLYPGSPRIVAELLRPQDRLMACELHPEDASRLHRVFRVTPQAAIHRRDGYEAIRALLPPRPQTRGLVLLDPPFEQPDEFARLADAVAMARARFSTGIVAAWYPIKHRAPVRAFHDALRDRGLRALLACELTLRPPLDPERLNGSGLLIANPPWPFAETANTLLTALLPLLAPEGEGAVSVDWIAEE
ncbi:23S rRNA (adenine(2030)-N(6))-methyltransferase RlmJ [Acidomonas methanolica]|uniref:Ribosomal RNA large subunit methyltransferase J n=1 Tax=Acidomonas methanolica NBRC 104435 TaxID=1231351 RepID=A0A023D918_ACIMT|nr:23S rRNA (adenine(2030)-N(6))-methyltransferase RlmJ [Acidomonas methanolica]MBU2654623.1 23S rRNA (adenine(2030)-N(6))-methyltransferase RlmJ [Acidomonas methanolica]TCS27496.1 23S rRNA (adenine2030-N6)-methyltransferase [Acidomonas methanolica]GAJ30296.1 hypothetical protein Amme_119_011 [Acidomonas methanolica NBRC 104435]GBQ57528.1 hypothetical protein AA0498_2529 [Acidomonas methanolica]GEK98597.1 ribosomal RNA large subunit methyltransferase J [Acidomonas methanolica NBRC 104435]